MGTGGGQCNCLNDFQPLFWVVACSRGLSMSVQNEQADGLILLSSWSCSNIHQFAYCKHWYLVYDFLTCIGRPHTGGLKRAFLGDAKATHLLPFNGGRLLGLSFHNFSLRCAAVCVKFGTNCRKTLQRHKDDRSSVWSVGLFSFVTGSTVRSGGSGFLDGLLNQDRQLPRRFTSTCFVSWLALHYILVEICGKPALYALAAL